MRYGERAAIGRAKRIRTRRYVGEEPSMNRVAGTIALIAFQSREALSGSRHSDVPMRATSFPSGSNLALFKTDSSISARRNSLSAREIIPVKQHNSANAMPSPQYSAQQEFLRHLARLARVNAVTVRALGTSRYLLSALIQGKTQE